MAFSKEQINKFANIMRINVSDSDIEKMNINSISDWFLKLQKINTEDVIPLFTPAENNITTREDVVNIKNSKDDILSNAPDKDAIKIGYFAVPKVIEE